MVLSIPNHDMRSSDITPTGVLQTRISHCFHGWGKFLKFRINPLNLNYLLSYIPCEFDCEHNYERHGQVFYLWFRLLPKWGDTDMVLLEIVERLIIIRKLNVWGQLGNKNLNHMPYLEFEVLWVRFLVMIHVDVATHLSLNSKFHRRNLFGFIASSLLFALRKFRWKWCHCLATPKKLSCNFDKKSFADEPTTFCVSPNQRSIGTKAHAMALPSARVQKCLLREATQVDRRMGPWNPKEPFR